MVNSLFSGILGTGLLQNLVSVALVVRCCKFRPTTLALGLKAIGMATAPAKCRQRFIHQTRCAFFHEGFEHDQLT
jgi:hypothetical protein